MNKILSATLAATLLSSTAFAADLPARIGAVAPAPAAASNWGGVYFGVQGGVGAGNSKPVLSVTNTNNFYADVAPRTGFGGLHAGYNWMVATRSLFGLEGDIELGASANSVLLRQMNGSGVNASLGGETRYQASLRARAGYLIANNLMVYGTGGVAFADYRLKSDFNVIAPRYSGFMTGWTIGAGAEVAISGNLRARAEYRYSDFGSVNMVEASNVFWAKAPLTQHSVRLGLSYAFGGSSAVVAKY